MDTIPPSYESAVARNPWRIVAPYIPSTDLCSLSRVSRRLNEVFAPCLWGNPASHFGTENDRVYVALTRFKRTLKRVRLSVRELTHTLHLPPAQSEIYDGPHAKWLRDVLEQLPKLQSLVVSRLPFFDHMALLALKNRSDGRRTSSADDNAMYSLRLLIATHCRNTTSQGLAEALDYFPHLAFLDLSNTFAARDRNVLSRLDGLPMLQILKLRSINLRDDDMEIITTAIGLRVRSLDVQGNHLTDHSIRFLLSSSIKGTVGASDESTGRLHSSSNLAVEDWPSGFVRPDPAILDEFKDQSYDERFVRRLTSGAVSRLPYEDLSSSGITHLYIANNNLTVEGLASLIRSKKLHVLDAGSPHRGAIFNRSRPSFPNSTSHPNGDDRLLRIPGAEKLAPILGKYGEEMTSLRLHHAIVTEIAPNLDDHPTASELSANEAMTEPDAAVHEMDATPPLYELEPREPVPRFELPGDSAHVVVSPPIGGKPTLSKDESQPRAKGDGVFAPEVVEEDGLKDEESPVLTATGDLDTRAQAMNGISRLTVSGVSGTENLGMGPDRQKMQLTLIEKQRQELRSSRLDKPHGLIPGMVPKLRSLTLTDVPIQSGSERVHQALIQFIRDCAAETELAACQARTKPDTMRKPGERQSKHHHHTARETFALKQIVLEMAPMSSSPSSHNPKSSNFTRVSKSSTEDADSEALWSAAENDFTFFDDDEECGLPSVEPDSYVPYSALSEKIIMPSDGDCEPKRLPTLKPSSLKQPKFDVVQELAQFRKERKAAYENGVQRGVYHVEGYWPGEVKIIRGHQLGSTTDYYGNQFEKTGVYR